MRVALLLGMLALAACSDAPTWRDTSGRGRGYGDAVIDQQACETAIEHRPQNSLGAQTSSLDLGREQIRICMRHRGWMLAR